MFLLNNNFSINPKYNLALEEELINSFQYEPILYIWQNDKSIILGKNQLENLEYDPILVQENNIDVVRRNSGGGAVFHDLGNINISYIDYKNSNEFEKVPIAIKDFLYQNFGLKAEIKGRNDIYINNQKISGWAQYITGDKKLIHGTLLFDSDMNLLNNVLTPDYRKVKRKIIKSNVSKTNNISNFLTKSVKINEFKESLLEYLKKHFNLQDFNIGNKLLDSVQYCYKTKYCNDNWNLKNTKKIGKIEKSLDFGQGIIRVNYNNNSLIYKDILISGDFFSEEDIFLLEDLLENKSKKEIKETLNNIKLNDFIKDLKEEDFLDLFD